eukprot:scaffold7254_cov115-Isochrysis_galbana.AAC.5
MSPSTSASGRPRLQTAAPQLELRRPPDRGAAAAPSLESQWRRRSRPPGERSAPALTHGCRYSACAPTTPDPQPPHPSTIQTRRAGSWAARAAAAEAEGCARAAAQRVHVAVNSDCGVWHMRRRRRRRCCVWARQAAEAAAACGRAGTVATATAGGIAGGPGGGDGRGASGWQVAAGGRRLAVEAAVAAAVWSSGQ